MAPTTNTPIRILRTTMPLSKGQPREVTSKFVGQMVTCKRCGHSVRRRTGSFRFQCPNCGVQYFLEGRPGS